MAYNYGPPPGFHGQRQQSYAPSGAMGFPPMGMAPPLGFAAPPGMDAAPGMAAASPTAMQTPFMPPNLPNVNFNAPVIRLGVDGQRPGPASGDRGMGGRGDGRGSNSEPLGNRGRLGLGASDGGPSRNLDRERQHLRETVMVMQPPTREELARTIFIGGLVEGVPDDNSLENMLRCAGKLRRWTRARDADDKKCKFGFAEYEDVESLEAASEIFNDVEVPLVDSKGVPQMEAGKEGDEKVVKKTKLRVVVDEQSMSYIQEWKGRSKEDSDARNFRIDGCKEDLRQGLAALFTTAEETNGIDGTRAELDADGDVAMRNNDPETKADGAEIVTIPLELDDELADIPAEMRATVAEEIKAFRDRSNRRDVERLRREEEMEQAERQRSAASSRPVNRLASPGPASSANGIPVGPRSTTGVQGAPSGPRGYRGGQFPSDYANGVAFVLGAGPNGSTVTISVSHDDDDAEESDEELERRREAKQNAEFDRQYQDLAQKWQNRNRSRRTAIERERLKAQSDLRRQEEDRERLTNYLATWDDDEEARKQTHEYYADRSSWARRRNNFREQEARDDERDRAEEEREKAEERRKTAEAQGEAASFLDQMGSELEAARAAESAGAAAGPGFGGFKISLGSAAAKTKLAQSASAPRRAMADVEGLLEDEEDAASSGMKRPELKPLQDTSTVPISGQGLTDEEKDAARQSLASEIPFTAAELFVYPIKWASITPTILDSQIRPVVERKVIDLVGIQEDFLVDTVVNGISDRQKAEDIVAALEGPLEKDEAETFVRTVWRVLIFWSEVESRGLSG